MILSTYFQATVYFSYKSKVKSTNKSNAHEQPQQTCLIFVIVRDANCTTNLHYLILTLALKYGKLQF